MRRRLLPILASLSLILCIAVTTLWVRCYFPPQRNPWTEALYWGRIADAGTELHASNWTLRSAHGLAYLELDDRRFSNPLPANLYSADGWPSIGVPRGLAYGRGNIGRWPGSRWDSGFGYLCSSQPVRPPVYLWQDYRQFTVPYWSLFLLTAALPTRFAIRSLRHRHKPGHCATCGYDLRASPDYCPECGRRP